MEFFDGNNRNADRSGTSRWPTLALLCVAQFVVVLDATIVAIALPSIQRDLGFSQASLQWVISAYTLVFGGFLMLAGRAADLYGRRKLFMVGLALFSAASVACGLATSPLALVAFRVAQGLGAAIVSPSALSILTTTFSEEKERGRALGVWTAAAAGGGAAGWVLGGVITQGLGWAWIFFINIPVGVLGLILAPKLLEESRDRTAPPRLDVAGAATITLGLTLLIYGLTRAEEAGFGSSETLVLLCLSIGFIATFIVIETQVEHPLLPLESLRSRRLAVANLAALTLTASTTPAMLMCVLYVQRVLGQSPAEAGLAFPPFNAAVIAGSLIGPRFADRVGARTAMVSGLLAIASSILLLTSISPESSYAGHLLPGFVVMGCGLGIASVASTASGASAIGEDMQGLASGLLNTSAQFGTALGLAVLIPLSAARTDLLTNSGVQPNEALIGGFRVAFFGAAGIAVFGAIVALTLLTQKEARKRE